jgi:hypothetical protein
LTTGGNVLQTTQAGRVHFEFHSFDFLGGGTTNGTLEVQDTLRSIHTSPVDQDNSDGFYRF